MKELGILFAAAIAVVAMVSGVRIAVSVRSTDAEAATDAGRWGQVHVYRDPLTGCEYVGRGVSSALTPRLGTDGKPMCGEVEAR